MKKTLFSLAAVVASFFVAQSAMAGCASEVMSGPFEVDPDPAATFYLIPNKAGTHAVKYRDFFDSSGTKITFHWSNNNGVSWNYITENEVTPTEQTQSLYAGSSNIVFRFVYTNAGAYNSQYFYFRRCIN